jgi:hypothetical protein
MTNITQKANDRATQIPRKTGGGGVEFRLTDRERINILLHTR